MEKENDSNEKHKGAHIADNKKFNFHRFITFFLIILFIIFTFLLFLMPYMSFKENENTQKSNSQQNYYLGDEVAFENVDYLTSKDLKIDVQNGVSKVKGIIFNSSQVDIYDLKCAYTLFDDNNSVIYELDIPISNIKANNQSAFSSISVIDLSIVTHYTVKLID